MTEKAARRFQRGFFARAGRNAEILKAASELIPGCFFNIVDDADRIVAFNRANCDNCNFRNEFEAVGRRLGDLFPAALASAYSSLYREAREKRSSIMGRKVYHGADRSTAPRIANVFPVFDTEGKVIGTCVFYFVTQHEGHIADWYGAVRKAVDFIDRHYAEKLSTAQLAEKSGMAESTFRRMFSEILGTPPAEYVQIIRINRARELLAGTALPLEAIAAECGFCDQSHLTKVFKRLRRQTPHAYRLSIRSSHPSAPATGKKTSP